MLTASYVSASFPRSAHGAFAPFRTKISLVAGNYRDNFLDVFPDLMLQYDDTNIVSAAFVLVHLMGGAGEESLPLFKIFRGGVVQLLLAMIAEHKAGEHITLACCRSAMPLLTNFLYLVEHLLGDDCGVRAIKCCDFLFPLTYRYPP